MEVSNIFSNFTEETCTGTGLTLALAGATTGNIPFSKSYADGDLVAYVTEDSGGIIKVSGVGTYVSATDDITRSDTWNWNGTVIDDSPATNITLSGGTHTVRCAVIDKGLRSPSAGLFGVLGCISANVDTLYGGFTANTFYAVAFEVTSNFVASKIAFEVSTLAASATARVGIYTIGTDGSPDQLIANSDSGDVSVATTGNKVTTVTPFNLSPGIYYAAMVGSSTTFKPTAGTVATAISNHIGQVAGSVIPITMLSGSFTYAALPQTAPTLAMSAANPLNIWLEV